MLEDDAGRLLITQRLKTASLGGLWEFPGGKVLAGETDQAALSRELRYRVDVDVDVGEQAMATTHQYETYDLEFHVYKCKLKGKNAKIRNAKVADHRWVRLDELGDFQFPDADAKTVAALLELEEV